MNPRISIPLAVLLVLTAGSLAYFIYYGQWFPPTVAVHFNGAGEPDGWMDRVKFIVIGTSFSFMLPPFIVALTGVLPRVLPVSMINLPNKDYWFALERRESTQGRLLYFALWLGCLVQAFLIAVWVSIGQANPAGETPHLSSWHAAIVIAFLGALAAYVFWVSRAFAKPR